MTIEFGCVDCPTHGYQQITDEQYDKQMLDADAPWLCPVCGKVGEWVEQEDMEYDDDAPAF